MKLMKILVRILSILLKPNEIKIESEIRLCG